MFGNIALVLLVDRHQRHMICRRPRRGGVRPIAFCAGAAALMLAGCANHTSSATRAAASVAEPPAPAWVAHQLAGEGASSVMVAVFEHGHEDVATAGVARPRADQRFRVGSVTKTFTATIVLQLVAERKIDLHDTLEHFLPGVVPAGARITVRDLLEHRSGLANFTDYASWRRRERPSRR